MYLPNTFKKIQIAKNSFSLKLLEPPTFLFGIRYHSILISRSRRQMHHSWNNMHKFTQISLFHFKCFMWIRGIQIWSGLMCTRDIQNYVWTYQDRLIDFEIVDPLIHFRILWGNFIQNKIVCKMTHITHVVFKISGWKLIVSSNKRCKVTEHLSPSFIFDSSTSAKHHWFYKTFIVPTYVPQSG